MATEEKRAVARSHRLNLIHMRKACSPTEGHTLLPMSQNDASQRSYNVQRDSNTIMALQAHALRHNTPDAAMNEWLKVGGLADCVAAMQNRPKSARELAAIVKSASGCEDPEWLEFTVCAGCGHVKASKLQTGSLLQQTSSFSSGYYPVIIVCFWQDDTQEHCTQCTLHRRKAGAKFTDIALCVFPLKCMITGKLS